MLAMADEAGIVHAAVPGLSRRAGVSLEECRRALEILSSPDAESRSPEHEGRRVESVDGGWHLLNYDKYREIRTNEAVQAARRMRKWREKQRNGYDCSVTSSVTPTSPPVTDASLLPQAEAEVESKAETMTTTETTAVAVRERRTVVGRRYDDVVAYIKGVESETLSRMTQTDTRVFWSRVVFSYWVAKFDHPRALLDSVRERAIVKALTANEDNVGELLYCVAMAARDEWAKQELGRHDVTVLFSDRSHVEKYASRSPAFKRGEPHPLIARATKGEVGEGEIVQ